MKTCALADTSFTSIFGHSQAYSDKVIAKAITRLAMEMKRKWEHEMKRKWNETEMKRNGDETEMRTWNETKMKRNGNETEMRTWKISLKEC